MKQIFSFLLILIVFSITIWAAVPTTINDFFLPGSQPNESGNLESPDKCDNCHGDYDQAVEPTFNWQGSMMAQAARDPLYYATVSIANQDAPESGDLCLRCHTPQGWLEGRSVPTDGSALTASDREGVMCDYCHKMVRPSELGVNPYPGDADYTSGTYQADQDYLATITAIPSTTANGMYVADANNAKRGPYSDAQASHQLFYSPFHSEGAICGTCHDVSNPAFSKDSSGKYLPNDFDQQAPDFDPYTMFPVERTFSEWQMSEYANTGVYAPQFGGNKDTVHTCQDCHMRDLTGKGCNKNFAPVRDDLPHHDMTGGNTFVPLIIDDAFPGETNQEALDSGIVRARYMLQNAATMNISAEQTENNFELEVEITNETGHKLPSGYPEGRRIWINVKAFNSTDDLIYESGAYDTATAILTHDIDAKIYEIKPGISQTLSAIVGLPAGPSFHFVLNDTIYSDNRIPPRGFTNANFEMIQSPPVDYSYADGQYYDETYYTIPGATAKVLVSLKYQTTSKEYVEFLRDENVTDNWGQIMYDLWSANGKSTPEIMNIDSLLLTPITENQAPVLADVDPQTVDADSNLNFVVTATDPDETIPVLSGLNLPASSSFTDHNDGTGTFDWTPTLSDTGLYNIQFIASDNDLADTTSTTITVLGEGCCNLRGDVSIPEDGVILVNDIVWIVNFLFKGGQPPSCLDEGDCAVPLDGEILINDIVWLVNFLFKGDAPPPEC